MTDHQQQLFPKPQKKPTPTPDPDPLCTCGHTKTQHNTPDALFEDTACLYSNAQNEFCACEQFRDPEKPRTACTPL